MGTSMCILLILAGLSVLAFIVSFSYLFNKDYKIYSKAIKIDLSVISVTSVALFCLSILGLIYIV